MTKLTFGYGVTHRNPSPFVGKVSIGVPAAEPVLTKVAEGKMLRYDTYGDVFVFKAGHKLSARDVKDLIKIGIDEVWIQNKIEPYTLNNFRVLRASGTGYGWVHDPNACKEWGIPEEFERIPILIDSQSNLKVSMLNWDGANDCVFCQSQDGVVAERLKVSTETTFSLPCIPSVSDANERGGSLCKYRTAQYNEGLPCTYRGTLSFWIPNKDGVPIGPFCLETTSQTSAMNWISAYQNHPSVMKDRFAALVLEVFKEETILPHGKTGVVSRTRTRFVDSVADQYLDTVKSMEDFPEVAIPQKVGAKEVEVWAAEFDPPVYHKSLIRDGLYDEEEILRTTGVKVSRIAGEFVKTASDAAFHLQRMELLNRARRLPRDLYMKLYAKRYHITSRNLPGWSKRVDEKLRKLTEDQKSKNYAENGMANFR